MNQLCTQLQRYAQEQPERTLLVDEHCAMSAGQLLAAVREGLRDCRENNPRTWAANMVVWTEVKYRFEPDGFFATAARIERMNAAAYEQLGPLVDGWVDAFAMSKAMPEMSRDCNHWKQTADQMLFSMVLNKAEASPKFPHA